MGYLNTLLKDIFRGTSEGDGTGDGARDAGKIINDNFDQVDNALQEIDGNAEKKTNRVTNLDLPSDTQYPTSKAVSDALSGLQTGWESYTDDQLTQYQQISEKGQANGYAPLDATWLVPTANLPAYVEEIVEGTYINSTTFNDGGGSPITPATNKIYVDTTTSKVYRWGGSTFAEIVASPGTTDEVPEGTNNKYFTADRVRAVLLTGYEVVVGFTVSATDNIVTAIGKLQGQINLINISLAGKLAKAGYTGTAQDLKNLIDTKQTALQVQTLIDQAESTALDKRMALLADDLDTAEQDAIKAKLNITGGGTSYTPPSDYNDVAALLADQTNQVENEEYTVKDASGWSTISHSGWATFKKKAASTASESDYELREQQDFDTAPETFTATQNQYGTHPAFASQNEAIIWLLQNGGGGSSQPAPSMTISNVTSNSFDYAITDNS